MDLLARVDDLLLERHRWLAERLEDLLRGLATWFVLGAMGEHVGDVGWLEILALVACIDRQELVVLLALAGRCVLAGFPLLVFVNAPWPNEQAIGVRIDSLRLVLEQGLFLHGFDAVFFVVSVGDLLLLLLAVVDQPVNLLNKVTQLQLLSA